MLELLFIEEAAESKQGLELLDYLLVRLPRLVGYARKLVQAGWRMGVTVRGFLFEPPDAVMAEVEKERDLAAALERHVRELGIEEPFEFFPARTLAEVQEAAGQLEDRVWYDRKLDMLSDPKYDRAGMVAKHPDIVQGMLRHMQRIEQEGLEEEFPYEDDYQRGMIDGKLSALRWVFGDDWDNLDT
jgi:hypothetical protein